MFFKKSDLNAINYFKKKEKKSYSDNLKKNDYYDYPFIYRIY